MKLSTDNTNYSAVVVRINSLLDLQNADRLVGISHFGMQAIVSKGSYEIGQLGILFPTECQLSEDLARTNNLYSHSELNADQNTKGYLGDNRRVKALKLRGNVSNALFLPFIALDYLGVDTSELKAGDEFDTINGVEVCRKYVRKFNQTPGSGNKTKGQTKRFIRIDNKTFPEHWDTDSFFRNVHKYINDDTIIVTQKLHGTSARFTNQVVARKLNWKERLAQWFGVSVNKTEYDTLAGSRRVIKDIKANDNHVNFYEVDLWNQWLTKIQHVIPKNWVLYGEIIGYSSDSGVIQSGYTYNCNPGESALYIYRVTVVNQDGVVCDLGWQQIKDFCLNSGLNYVPELWSGRFEDFVVDDWMNISYYNSGLRWAVPLSKDSPCDEGVCIRLEGLSPYVTKAKSPAFLGHETEQLSSDKSVDLEAQQEPDDTPSE